MPAMHAAAFRFRAGNKLAGRKGVCETDSPKVLNQYAVQTLFLGNAHRVQRDSKDVMSLFCTLFQD